MSDWIAMYTHRTSGETFRVHAMDDYFGRDKFGYKFPDGKILREDEFEQRYSRSDDQEPLEREARIQAYASKRKRVEVKALALKVRELELQRKEQEILERKTLRDEFAMAVAPALVKICALGGLDVDEAADGSYDMAEALMQRRLKEK